MRLFLIIFYVLLILIGVSFAALNAASITLNFYIAQITIPVSVAMTLALGLGVFLGFLLFCGKFLRVRYALKKEKNQTKMLEKEIQNLRAIPLKDQH